MDAALHLPARELGGDALGDGLRVVVIAVLNHDDTDAFGVVLRPGPDALGVILAHNHDERGSVETAVVREGSGGVAGAGADEALTAMVVHSLDGRNRLHVLETPCGAEATLLGPVAVVGYPKVGQSHGFSKRLSTVRHGAGNEFVGL